MNCQQTSKLTDLHKFPTTQARLSIDCELSMKTSAGGDLSGYDLTA